MGFGPLEVLISSICISMCILGWSVACDAAFNDQIRLKYDAKIEFKFFLSSSDQIMFGSYLNEFWSVGGFFSSI